MPKTRKVSAPAGDVRKSEAGDTFQNRVGPSASEPAIAEANSASAAAARSTDTVLVGCKLPNGLIMEIVEPNMLVGADGKPLPGALVPQPLPIGKRYFLKGANSVRENPRAQQGVHPYAMTRVPRAFWDAWLERHKDRDFVKNGLVFVAEDDASARDMAKEFINQRTGLEGLNQQVDKDPRMPKASNPNAQVETDPASVAQKAA
jgi:hypothetical protein